MRDRLVLIAPVILLLAACSGGEKPSGGNPARTDAGQQLYQARCSYCHGASGAGDTAMAGGNPAANLADGSWSYGGSVAEIEKTIAEGVPDTAMSAFRGVMNPEEISQVARYVMSFESKKQ